MPTTLNTTLPSEVINEFASEMRNDGHVDQGFFVTVALIELLRRATPSQILSMQKFLSAVADNNFVYGWNEIGFSLTQDLLSTRYHSKCLNAGVPQEDVPFVLSTALALLSDAVVTADPDKPAPPIKRTSEDMSDSVTAVLSFFSASEKEALPAEPPPPSPRQSVALVDTTRYVPECFSPPPLSYEKLRELDAEYISHRGTLSTGELSSEVRGLMLQGPHGLVAFLESGEFLDLSPGQLGVATYSENADLKHFPTTTFMYFMLAADRLYESGAITETQRDLLLSGAYGTIDSQRLEVLSAPVRDLEVLDDALAASATLVPASGLAAPQPIDVDFDILIGDRLGVFRTSANYAESGSYITSKFGYKEEKDADSFVFKPVLMQTVPRFMTALGVYVFPVPSRSLTYALVVV